MPMSTSPERPTFTPRSSTFPTKIAIEEAVATSVFSATTKNPPEKGTLLRDEFLDHHSGHHGRCDTRGLVKICGEDKVLWSVDHPYESYEETAEWFDHLEMNERTRAKIGSENARRLLKL